MKIIKYASLNAGPKLIITGAVHGNQKAGAEAIAMAMDFLDQNELTRGSVTFVPVVNEKAYELNERGAPTNLNRDLKILATPITNEEKIATRLCPELAANDVLLDLHSFKVGDEPFALIGPRNNIDTPEPFRFASEEEDIVKVLGVRTIAFGWLASNAFNSFDDNAFYSDTEAFTPPDPLSNIRFAVGTTEYTRSNGGYACTLECGQHADPNAKNVGYNAILNALQLLNMLDRDVAPPKPDYRCIEMQAPMFRTCEEETLAPDFKNFSPIAKGQALTYKDGAPKKVALQDGFIMFPGYASGVGEKMGYFATASDRIS